MVSFINDSGTVRVETTKRGMRLHQGLGSHAWKVFAASDFHCYYRNRHRRILLSWIVPCCHYCSVTPKNFFGLKEFWAWGLRSLGFRVYNIRAAGLDPQTFDLATQSTKPFAVGPFCFGMKPLRKPATACLTRLFAGHRLETLKRRGLQESCCELPKPPYNANRGALDSIGNPAHVTRTSHDTYRPNTAAEIVRPIHSSRNRIYS